MDGRMAWMYLFRFMDKNMDSSISREEWSSAFDTIDADGDGFISRKEWFLQQGTNYMFDKVVGLGIATIKQSDWVQAFNMFDVDGDGAISEQDWQKVTKEDLGDDKSFDVFLGYRVASDAELVERIYDKCVAKGLKVWWDRRCLPPGMPWENGFADGLLSSSVFVPVISKAGVASCAMLTASSPTDNVVFEYRMALDLIQRGELRRIFPILVGEQSTHPELGNLYGDFFKGGGAPRCGTVTIDAVEQKLIEHLQRVGYTRPLRQGMPLNIIFDAIFAFQGTFLKGVVHDSVEKVVADICRMVRESKNSTPLLPEVMTSLVDPKYPNISLREYIVDPNYWYINSQYPGLQAISKEPWIFLVHDFLTAAECAALLAKGEHFEPSSTSLEGEIATNSRTSSSVSLAYSETPGLHAKFARLLGGTHSDTHSQLECLTVVRYQVGQQFQLHSDAFIDQYAEERDRDHELPAFGGAKCINRIATIWAYLNDVLVGGLTSFPRIDNPLKIQPKKGMAVVHFPALMHTAPGPFHEPHMDKGYPDQRVYHAGEPAMHEKWLCVACAYPEAMEIGKLRGAMSPACVSSAVI